MSLLFKQLSILLWKSWIIRKRHWISTIFELFSPLVLAFFIAWIYSTVNSLKPQENNEEFTDISGPQYSPQYSAHPSNNDSTDPVIFKYPTINLNLDKRVSDLPVFTIYYGPNTSEIKDLMNRVNRYVNRIYIYDLETGDAVNAKMATFSSENSSLKYGIIFDQNSFSGDRLNYTIRMFGNMAYKVNKLFPDKWSIGPADDNPEYYDEFCIIQIWINNAFVDRVAEKRGKFDHKVVKLSAYKLPFPAYKRPKDSHQKFSLPDLIAMTIVIGYVVMCPLIVKRITDEKATKAKELLRMIGMSDWVFWLSHFLSFFPIMVFHSIVFTYLFCFGISGEPIIEKSNIVLIFTIFTLFSVQTILFCMTLTTVFNRPVVAVIVTVIVWIISYSVPFGVLNPVFYKGMDVIGTNKWRFLSVYFPNMGLSWAFANVGQFEIIVSGAQWSSLFKNTIVYGYLTLGLVMFSMIISCLIYIFLIWYLDNVWPFQYGVPKSPFFLFYRSYWFPSITGDDKPETPKSDLVIDTRNYEREPDTPTTIVIRNLTKVFGGFGTQPKTVVNNLSLNIYDKQITALLGHNGAGKTTTMNMITGIYPPTSGTVLVNGYDIQTATKNARRSIGLCPQENIIFNELTVAQHLKLYAILKGYDWNSVDLEIKNTLELLKLTDKMNEMAVSLSGGMKRKLSLGIALIGGTKILILDEPTSGLDPEARRIVWDLLQQLRLERTILLTTHYMEEADVLGDRIAIMCEGRIKCCGSPIFLKKRYGAGYHFRVSKGIGFKASLLEMTLQKYLPKAHLNSEIQSEVIYVLESDKNNTQNTTSVFPQLFDEIETNKEKLGIASCGLTVTTMEDVFIRVGNEFEGSEDQIQYNRKHIKNKSSESLLRKKHEFLSGFQLEFSRFYGLLLKRFHFAKRYWPMSIFQLLIPGLLFVVALLLDNTIRNSVIGDVKDLNLNLYQLYGNTVGFFKTTTVPRFQDYKTTADIYSMTTEDLGNEDPNDWALNNADDLENYSQHYLIGAITGGSSNGLNVDVWYNNEALHSLPISINMFYEAFLRYITSESTKEPVITVFNHPLTLNSKDVSWSAAIVGWVSTCLILVPITVPFIGASYVLFPINERISKAKLLQLMTGLSTVLFWISNFIFDLINHLIVVIIIFIIFAVFDTNGIFFGRIDTAMSLLLMLFLFGFASIPLAYCFSLYFAKPSTGFTVLVIIYLVFGVIAITSMGTIDFIMNSFKLEVITKWKFDAILSVLRLVPVFSMSFGIQKIYRIGSFAQICRLQEGTKNLQMLCKIQEFRRDDMFYGCCIELCSKTNDCYKDRNPLALDSNGAGIEFLFLVGTGLLFMGCLIFFESHWIRKVFHQIFASQWRLPFKKETAVLTIGSHLMANEDSDVIAEKYRIEALSERHKLTEEAMAVINLTKKYGSFVAVDNLTFGLHKEECFGLLGVNGAGKTTTFQMLTGDLMLSDGNAFIGNHSVRDNLKSLQKQIGYCPQFDALLEKLTAKEMLYLFARLRGLPTDVIESEVESLIEMCDLQKHAYKCTETYSGGNRRKLSLALSIIGTPAVIFLDEPTAGVDPSARRKIWSTLVYIQEKYHSSIVLTSHSMEECEALCSRIAIMVNGKFKCLGPTQHLRKRFGQGFTIVIKLKRELNDDINYVQSVQQFIQQSFPSAVLKDAHQLLLHFHITDTTVQWSYMFSQMESAKQQLQLEDYFVSDTTLEQIFLAFAKTQR